MRLVPPAFIFLFLLTGPALAQQGTTAGPVPINLLKQRRDLLLDRIGEGVMLLPSGREQGTQGDDYPQASDYREDDDFFYLTGLEAKQSWLVLIAHKNAPDQVILYLPPRDEAEEEWTGPRLSARDATTFSGIADVRSSEKAADEIGSLLKLPNSFFVKMPARAQEICAGLAPDRRRDCVWLFLRPLKQSPAPLEDARPQLAALRLIKDADEIRRMRRAVDITADALRGVMQRAEPGQWEYELEALLEYVFQRSGAERVGFPSIIASGPNATTLHYDKSRRRTQAGDLVVMDVGAEYGYYTADVTRTMPINGRFSARQRALYDLVLATQQATIDSVRPGVTIPQLDEIARQYMRRHSGRLCGVQTCDNYFVHGIGHWLGMNVHDPGSLSTPLAAGMILTVEPGIYLQNESLGIRIEDVLLVTANGAELLSKGAPRSAAEIERLMASTDTSAKSE